MSKFLTSAILEAHKREDGTWSLRDLVEIVGVRWKAPAAKAKETGIQRETGPTGLADYRVSEREAIRLLEASQGRAGRVEEARSYFRGDTYSPTTEEAREARAELVEAIDTRSREIGELRATIGNIDEIIEEDKE